MAHLFDERIEIFPSIFISNPLGEEVFGYDIKIRSDTATISDYLSKLNDFANKYLAPCLGCDGCCHERVPLISTDIYMLEKLLPYDKYPAHSVINSFCDSIISPSGAVDIVLKRHRSGCCKLLSEKEKCCNYHQTRPFTCRSYYCLNKSYRAEALRNAIINAGEDELIRLLWQEEKAGAINLLNNNVNIHDYPENGFVNKKTLSDVLIKDVIPQELWLELLY